MEAVTAITGGAEGLGLAAAKLIGSEHGVVVCDINAGRLEARLERSRALNP